MLGEPKGYVIVDKDIKHTKTPGISPNGIDLTKDYFDALRLKLVPVIDIAVEGAVGDEYIVKGKGEKTGTFLWFLDKRDTITGLIPYKVFNPMPSIEELVGLLTKMTKGEFTAEDVTLLNSLVAKMGVSEFHRKEEK